MASADKYAAWIVANANKRGTAEFNTVAQAYEEAKRSEVAPPTPAPIAAPQKKEGFFGAFGRSFKEGAGTLSYADEAAAYAQKKDDASRKALLEASKSNAPEGKQGLGAYLGELAGGSVGQMVAPGLAGLGAGLAAAPTIVGAPVAGITAATAVNTAQYAAQNMRRQALEQEQALREGRAATGPDGGKALLAAVPQAALDTVGGKVFGPLLSKFPILRNLAIPGGKAEKAFAEVLSKGAFESVGGGVVRGVAGGAAFEVPQEIAQQALERWQAGLPLSGKDAMEEYKSAAVGALVLGGGVGGVQGAVVSAGERAKALKEKDAAEAAANAPAAIAPLAGTGNLPPTAAPAAPAGSAPPAKVTTKMVEDSEEYKTLYEQGLITRTNAGDTDAKKNARKDALRVARPRVEAELRAAAAPPAPSPEAVANAKQLVVDTFNDQSSDFEGPDGAVVPLTPEQLDFAAGLTVVGEDPRGAIDRAKEAIPNETQTQRLDLGAAELGAGSGGGDQSTEQPASVVQEPDGAGVVLGAADTGPPSGAAGDVNAPVELTPPAQVAAPEVLTPPDAIAAPPPPVSAPVNIEAVNSLVAQLNNVEDQTFAGVVPPKVPLTELENRAQEAAVAAVGRAAAEPTADTTQLFKEELSRRGFGGFDIAPEPVSEPIIEPAPTPVAAEPVGKPPRPAKPPTPEQELKAANKAARPSMVDAKKAIRAAAALDPRAGWEIIPPAGKSDEASADKAVESAVEQVFRPLYRLDADKPFSERTPEELRGLVYKNLEGRGFTFKEPAPKPKDTYSYRAVPETSKSYDPQLPYQIVMNGIPMQGFASSPEAATANVRKLVEGRDNRTYAEDFAPVEAKAAPAPAAEEKPKEEPPTPKPAMTQEAIKARAAAMAAKRAPAAPKEEPAPKVAEKVEENAEPTSNADLKTYRKFQEAKLVAAKEERDRLAAEAAARKAKKEAEAAEEAKKVAAEKAAKKADAAKAAEEKAAEDAKAEELNETRYATAVKNLNGVPVYRNGNRGLVRGYNKFTGAMGYAAVYKSNYWLVDIDSDSMDGKLPREIREELSKAKKADIAAENKKHEEAPYAPYDAEGLSFGTGVDSRVVGVVREWKKLFLKGAKIHVANFEDIAANRDKYTGPMRAIGSATLDANENGSARRVGENEYYVAFKGDTAQEVLEIIAHEMGHILQKEAFDGASPELKNELFAAHKEWLAAAPTTTREYIDNLRAPATAANTGKSLPEGHEVIDLANKAYWKSFSEWFADQTARWAISDAKPQSAIEKFFKTLGEQLKKFFLTVKGQKYLPNEKFKTFIERVVQADDFAAAGLGRGKWSGTEKPQAAKRRAANKPTTTDTVKNVAASQTPEAKLSAALKASLTSFDDLLRLYNVLKDTIAIPVLNKLLGGLATSQVIYMGRKDNPRLKNIEEAVVDLNMTRHRRLTDLIDKSTWWGDFARKDPQGAADLADIMHLSTLLGVDPTKFASLDDALKGDTTLNDLRAEERTATGPAKTRARKAVKGREENLELVYKGGTRTDGDGKTYTVPGWAGLASRGAKATVDVRTLGDDVFDPSKDTYEKRSMSEAQRIYTMVKNTYEDNLRDHVRALTDVVRKSGVDEGQRDKAVKDITAAYQEEWKRGVYFPLTRSGDFWLRIGKAFKTFDTRMQRDLEIERVLKEEGRTREDMFGGKKPRMDAGDDVNSLRSSVAASSEVLKDLMKAVEGLDANSVADAKESFAELAYQIYLKTLPQGDLRARFSHRKGTAGFSPDALRGFVDTQYASANQISRLEHADAIRGAVSAARAFLDGNPNKVRLMPFVKEMDLRAQAELTPAPLSGDSLDRIASGVNRVVFFMMLTSPKSALIQFTQLPIVGIPVLSAAYGTGKAVAMVGKYMNVFGKLKPATRVVPGMAPGEETVRWDELNMAGSEYNKSLTPEKRELLERIHAYANDRGMFSDTYASDANDQRNTRTEDYTGAGAKVSRKVTSFITGGFHQVERMTRQIMVMSAGELEYNKLRASGVSHSAAMEKAAKAAVDTTHQAMFNYTTFEKPRYFQKGLGRMTFQFMTFPLHMIGYLGVNFVNTFKGDSPELRKEAATRFFGTMGMTAMFGGTTALPFYSAVMGMLSAIRDQFTDDGDDEDEDGNPLGMRNMDLWFRTKFIPTMFGPGSDFALSTGMSDEQAKLMVRSLLMGPLSALSGMNLGASTSLDFFKNEAPEARNSTEAIQRTFFTTVLGPSGSLALNFGRSVEDIQAGDVMRGIERSAPAFFRGAMTSARYAKEGALTPDKAEMKSAEYFTTGKLMYQALGFGDTELADLQKTNILTKNLVEDIKREQNKLLDRMDKAQFRYDANPTDANDARIEAVWEDIDAYNEKNWDVLPIKPSTVTRSLKGRDESRDESIDGLVIGDKKLRNAAEDLLESVR